jgi:hypothetical protein
VRSAPPRHEYQRPGGRTIGDAAGPALIHLL